MLHFRLRTKITWQSKWTMLSSFPLPLQHWQQQSQRTKVDSALLASHWSLRLPLPRQGCTWYGYVFGQSLCRVNISLAVIVISSFCSRCLCVASVYDDAYSSVIELSVHYVRVIGALLFEAVSRWNFVPRTHIILCLLAGCRSDFLIQHLAALTLAGPFLIGTRVRAVTSPLHSSAFAALKFPTQTLHPSTPHTLIFISNRSSHLYSLQFVSLFPPQERRY